MSGMCGVCVGYVSGMCGVCVGYVVGMCGVCVGYVVGMWWSMMSMIPIYLMHVPNLDAVVVER